MRQILVCCLLIVISTVGCSSRPRVAVWNQSQVEISNVKLSGSGFDCNLGSVGPNATWKPLIRPRGESSIRVEFDVQNKHYDSGYQSYFEASGGYIVNVTIRPDLTISIKSNL